MEYKRVLKIYWKASRIWLNKVNIKNPIKELMTKIAAENKYWLYINGSCYR